MFDQFFFQVRLQFCQLLGGLALQLGQCSRFPAWRIGRGLLNHPRPFRPPTMVSSLEEYVSVRHIQEGGLDGLRVQVRGWLQNKRSGGGILFLLVRDGTGIVQCTLRREKVPSAIFDQLLSTKVESTVELKGVASRDPRAIGGWEVKVDTGRVLSPALEDFPIAKQFHGPDFLLDNRHLFLRSDKLRSMLRVRAALLSSARS